MEVAGVDAPSCNGIGRAWRVGKVRLAGDIHLGLLCCEYQKGAGKPSPGVAVAPMGCPHTTTHGSLGERVPRLQCDSRLSLFRVSEVLGDLCLSGPCAWGMSWPEEGMCSVQGFSCPGSWLVVDTQSLAAAEGVSVSAFSSVLLAPHS